MDNLTFKSSSQYHSLDCSKLKTVEDVVRVIEALRIMFQEGTEAYESLKPFLKEKAAQGLNP